MKMTTKKLAFLLLFLPLTLLYSIFFHYYVAERENTASVILDSLHDVLTELSFTLSKNLDKEENLSTIRPYLDRVVAQNDFISAILVVDNRNILLKTDPHIHKIPAKEGFTFTQDRSRYEQLLNKIGIEGEIRFYEGDKLKRFGLIFLFDKESLGVRIESGKATYILLFGLLPLIILALIALFLKYYMLSPLERLRQYAYYQSSVPDVMKLRELEAVRASMVQSFVRLENEQKELHKMARTDLLTGLSNRNALHEYLKRLFAEHERLNNEFALLFLDLDHFKVVNDSLGHDVGDKLLRSVAGEIAEVLRIQDFVARVGGDEFIIILRHYHSVNELVHVIDRVQNRIKKGWIIETQPITITSSIGVAFYPKDGADEVSLMKHADIAMYEAKKKGRNQFHFFTEALNQEVMHHIELMRSMKGALANGEYQLYYQPKVNLTTGAISGVEALIRWIHPRKGLIPPNEFIPLAEESGFIVELGEWILRTAAMQKHEWSRRGIDIAMSINIATKQLQDVNFLTKLDRILKSTGANPKRIDFEITEYVFMDDSSDTIALFNAIRKKGISVSLDDFGTGYSSLSYLKKFPIDHLKIDKSFVDDYNTERGAIFLETIVKMGQTLHMDIVAEGVETKEQMEALQNMGCTYYQGYLCSKPLPANEFETLFFLSEHE